MVASLLPALVAALGWQTPRTSVTPVPAALVAIDDGAPALVPAPGDSPAQLRLAEALADADSIDWVRADRTRGTVTFGIEHAGESYEIVVSASPAGDITSVRTADVGRGTRALGPLSWLTGAMSRSAAVARIEVGAAGEVTLVTDDGTRFFVVPARTGRPGGGDAGRMTSGGAWNGA